MNISKRDPGMVFFSTLMYRFLLITYPLDFRHEYASWMAQVFRDCSLRAYHARSILGMLSLWKLTLVDYIKSVFEEYTRAIKKMDPSHFIRLSGWSLILGTVTFLSGLIVYVQISKHGNAFNPYNFYSRPIDQFLTGLPVILLPGTMLLLTMGVIGLYLKYGLRAGILGRVGLAASIAGGILAFALGIAGGWYGFTLFLVGNQVGGWWLWNLATVALFLLFGGIFAFGIDSLKRQPLKRLSLVPTLVGSLIPLRIVAGTIQEAITPDGWTRWRVDMNMINTLILIVTSISLIALAYFLLFDKSQRMQPEME